MNMYTTMHICKSTFNITSYLSINQLCQCLCLYVYICVSVHTFKKWPELSTPNLVEIQSTAGYRQALALASKVPGHRMIKCKDSISGYWYTFCHLSYLSVCLPVWCIVAKRLIGSGCHFGWWVGWVEGMPHGKRQFWGKCGASHCNQWGLRCTVDSRCVKQLI